MVSNTTVLAAVLVIVTSKRVKSGVEVNVLKMSLGSMKLKMLVVFIQKKLM